jgi:hypothetical protein
VQISILKDLNDFLHLTKAIILKVWQTIKAVTKNFNKILLNEKTKKLILLKDLK